MSDQRVRILIRYMILILKVGYCCSDILDRYRMIIYILAKSEDSDMMRFFQAVSINMYRQGGWCWQPEKTS